MHPEAIRRWWTYLRERSPLPALAMIALAQTLSACYLVRQRLDWSGILLGSPGIVGLLVLMRLMDEIKDYDRDRIAHPERPLPRGLLTPTEVRRAVVWLGRVLGAYGVALAALRSPIAGGLYVLTVAYAFLMYHEFFLRRPTEVDALAYAAAHQVIVLPMYAFAVALVAPERALSSPALWFALTGLGASFTFEIARKLDPGAHPVLRTYLVLYGRGLTVAAVVGALALLSLGAFRLGVQYIVWPFVALVLALLPLLWLRPSRFRLIEGAATILGFVQMLAPMLRHLVRGLA